MIFEHNETDARTICPAVETFSPSTTAKSAHLPVGFYNVKAVEGGSADGATEMTDYYNADGLTKKEVLACQAGKVHMVVVAGVQADAFLAGQGFTRPVYQRLRRFSSCAMASPSLALTALLAVSATVLSVLQQC